MYTPKYKNSVRTILVGILTAGTIIFTAPFFGFVASAQTADDVVISVDTTTSVDTTAPPAEVSVEPASAPDSVQASDADMPAPDTTEPITSIISPDATSDIASPSPTTEVAAVVSAELTTDKADYHPGETANIFGRFFGSLKTYVLSIFGAGPEGNDYTETTQQVTTDEQGSFTTTYTLDNIFRPLYTMVTKVLGSDELVTQATFTDAANPIASIDVYSQCANGTASGPTCSWTNGNLNAQNSVYTEGDATVQRLAINELTPGQHTVTIQYDSLKGGKHAYDFLVDDKFSENWLTAADVCSSPITNFASCSSTPPVYSSVIPTAPNAGGFDAATSSRRFAIRNATWVSVGTPTVVSGADAPTNIQLTFNVPANCANQYQKQGNSLCEVLITFGAHISRQVDWGNGNSAVNISGSPYHVRVIELDGGTVGNRDNQMSATAIIIPQGTISGTKFNDLNANAVKDPSDTPLQNWVIALSGNGTSTTATTNAQGVFTFNGVPDGTYNVCEQQQASWTQTFPAVNTGNCVGTNGYSVTILNGNTVSAIDFGNTQSAHLTLVKTVTNNNGGTALPTAWTLSATGPTQISGTSGTGAVTNASVTAGTYTLAETNGPTGYTPSAWSCTNNVAVVNAQITLASGASTTCTINNDDQPATLTIIKNTVGGNDTFGFTVTGPSALTPSITTVGGTGSTGVVAINAGTYSVAEAAKSGWDLTSSSCSSGTPSSFTVANGGSVTCTFTNTKRGSLTIIKNTVGGDGMFNFTGNTGVTTLTTVSGTAEQTVLDLLPSVYNIAETVPAGWTLDSATCSDGSLVSAIDVAAGEHVTCTFTNTKKPTLTLLKTVVNNNGGTATAADFQGKIDGNNVAWGSAQEVSIGAHAASEFTLVTYAPGSWGGDCSANGSVTLAAGENKTCTITNDDIAPVLHLRKVVINDNGGTKTTADFTLIADGASTNDLSGVNPVDSGAGLKADTFALSEANVSGYSASAWSCVGGQQSESSITLGLGEEATCTITNDDIAPKLTVIKHVVNDNGGNNTAADFTMNVTGTDVSNPSFAGSEVGVTVTLKAGSYSVDEGAHDGYAKSVSEDCAGTIAVGEEKTCTITNNDQPAKITLIKHVINNNGGTAAANDFGLTVGGSSVLSGSTTDVNSNTPTALSEAGLTGYDFASLTGDEKCPSVLGGTVTLNEGENITCTITNDDQPAHLVVIKHVDNGATGATTTADMFTTTISGVTTAVPTAAGAEAGINNVLTTVGAYTVDEGAHAGYEKSLSVDCSGTIALGETKTCTITNTAIAPKLILVKTVINDNGGTKQVADFPLFIDGVPTVSGATNTVTVGVRFASETSDVGYLASPWGGDCGSGGAVIMKLGETKTCTITNDDIAPKLTLVKHVMNDNGGTAAVTDWTLSATGPTTISGAGGATSDVMFSAGTYTLSESAGPSGYIPSAWSCVKNTNEAAEGASITLSLGDEATCTIVNDDQQGHLIVHKITDPASDTTTQFSVTASGTYPVVNATQSVVGGGSIDYLVDAGTYTATEALTAGWEKTGDTCQNVPVKNGETKECTITNVKHGHVIVSKTTIPAVDTAVFSLLATGTGSIVGSASGVLSTVAPKDYEVTPGVYSVAEASSTGWDMSVNTCANIAVAAGETKTCAITNVKRGKITIVKDAQPNDLQDFTFSGSLGAFTLDDDQNVDGADDVYFATTTFTNQIPSQYTINEILPNQYWKLNGVSCVDKTGASYSAQNTATGIVLTLTPGAEVTCTFVNEKIAPTRTLGFWQTHTAYTTQQFSSKFTAGMLIGSAANGHKGTTTNIQSNGKSQLFGAFYANIAKTTANKQRTSLDKARMQLLQQLAAAKLNYAVFGGSPSVGAMITAADNAYAFGTESSILASAGQLDVYNNSGDTLTIGNAGKATPTTSKAYADLGFWDAP